jgi:hypothetical protein
MKELVELVDWSQILEFVPQQEAFSKKIEIEAPRKHRNFQS